MNKIFTAIQGALLGVLEFCLGILKPVLPSLASMAVKSTAGLTGVVGWVVSLFVKKQTDKLLDKAQDAIDNGQATIEDKVAQPELLKEMEKPLDQIDWDKVDELEKKGLEGR